MGDMNDASFVRLGIVYLLDVNKAAVADDVGVCQEFVGTHEKPGAVSAAHATDVPWDTIVGLLGVDFYPDNGIKGNLGNVGLDGFGLGDFEFGCWPWCCWQRPDARSKRSSLLSNDGESQSSQC